MVNSYKARYDLRNKSFATVKGRWTVMGGLFFGPLNIKKCYVPWAPLECFNEAADIACNICKVSSFL